MIACSILTVRELSALHTKRLMVTFDESEAERERDVEDATREVRVINQTVEQSNNPSDWSECIVVLVLYCLRKV